MQKIILALFLILNLAHAKSSAQHFETFGDIFQFAPAMMAIYPLAIRDWEGLGYLALSTGGTLALTFGMKYSFVAISKKYPHSAHISKRPIGGYDGFPSGHTSSAFSAAGFAQKRYGNALGIPTTIIATLVGFSRVVAEKHTIAQVLFGAILGYGFSYLVTSKNLNLNLDVGKIPAANDLSQNYYGISARFAF